jgi:hypothetical protein
MGVPEAGVGVPEAGVEVPEAGVEVPEAGVEVPEAGVEVPDAGSVPPDASGAADAAQDDAAPGPVDPCLLGSNFGLPSIVTGLPAPAFSPSLAADGLTLYFASAGEIYSARRSSVASLDFSQVTAVNNVNTQGTELTPSLSYDGLRLYFARGVDPNRDLFVAVRATLADPFDAGTRLTALSDAYPSVVLPRESASGLELFFASVSGPALFDIWVSRRDALSDTYGAASPVNELNTNLDENPGGLSSDGLTLLVTSKRTGTLGGQDIWVATRPSIASAFTGVVNETALNSGANDLDPSLSADAGELFFASDRDGQTAVYRSLSCVP